MKTSRAISLFTALLLGASLAAAQAPQPPKPGPEVQHLAYLAGDWKNEGTMHASAFGPGGKFTSTNHNEWFPGNFFLLSHSDSTLAGMGVVKGMAIFGYDPQKKVWPNQRVGQALNINGEDYKIVAISKDEVVLSAANQKKWPIKLNSPPPS